MAAYVWPNLDRDYKDPLYEQKVDVAIRCINPDMLENAIHEALFKLKNFDNADLVQKNAVFLDYAQHGVEVCDLVGSEERSGLADLVDYKNPDSNFFVIANQWTFIKNSKKTDRCVSFSKWVADRLDGAEKPISGRTSASPTKD